MKLKYDKEELKRYFAWVKYLLLAAGINFVIESASRHSAREGLDYLFETPLTFFYNTLVIGICYLAVYLTRRKVFACAVISVLWLAAGISNGVVLTNRVTPLTGPDFGMLGDVLSIIDLYMTIPEILLSVGAAVLAAVFLLLFYKKTPRDPEKIPYKYRLTVAALLVSGLLGTTRLAVEFRIVDVYFGNLAIAYQEYGFPYCFATSILDVGMDKPFHYSEKSINRIVNKSERESLSLEEGGKRPNIIFVQLETFIDPELLNNIEMSADPIPNFRKYMKEYSSGYYYVPVIGAGTANTEFETITGMNLRYFGPGEYPYKTVLKDTACDSMPFALKRLGYTAHALHNNNATFYGRNEVFANLGFDTYTSVEMMDGVEYNENGWADDSILTPYIIQCLESGKGPEYVYAISVQGHGTYPEDQILENPMIWITEAETEEDKNRYEYYVNQLYEMDQFVEELITAVEELGEDTVIVMYGDHLPTMGLTEEDIRGGTLYSTNYFIWDNIGLEVKDQNIYAYRMGAEILGRLGIHEGVMMQYHQQCYGSRNYMADMELLQYDILYGEGFSYRDFELPEEPVIQIGIGDFEIAEADFSVADRPFIYGDHFNEYSKIAVNGKEQDTILIGKRLLVGWDVTIEPGDAVTVQQIDAEGKVLRESNAVTAE